MLFRNKSSVDRNSKLTCSFVVTSTESIVSLIKRIEILSLPNVCRYKEPTVVIHFRSFHNPSELVTKFVLNMLAKPPVEVRRLAR